MNLLCFYVSEKQHHAGMPLYVWLLDRAKSLGISGGSAFRAIAGYGRHGKMHEDTFFELAGELAVKVEFMLDDADAERLLREVQDKKFDIPCVQQRIDFKVV